MTEQQILVLSTLRAARVISATDLGHRCGLAHEAIYEALVSLEASGKALVVVNYIEGSRPERLWRAAA